MIYYYIHLESEFVSMIISLLLIGRLESPVAHHILSLEVQKRHETA